MYRYQYGYVYAWQTAKPLPPHQISFCTARVKAQMVGHVTAFDISMTELKSPGLEIGNPASITSTPKGFQLSGYLNLFHCIQLASRNLLAIAERCVENK